MTRAGEEPRTRLRLGCEFLPLYAAICNHPTANRAAFQDSSRSGSTWESSGKHPPSPFVVDGKIIGSVGVSGVTSQQDAQIAQASIEAMK